MASQTVPLSDLHDDPPTTVHLSQLLDDPPSEQPEQSSKGALLLQAGAQSVPVGADLAARLATNPNVAKVVGAIARGGTTVAGVVHGAVTGNIPEVIAAPVAGWQAGKGGYFLGKGMQAVAAPVARALEKAAPYAQAASTLAGAQGVLDLAQMVDPKRTDIGVLGVGVGQPRSDEERAAHPALINGLIDAAVKKIQDVHNMTAAQAYTAIIRHLMTRQIP